VLAVTTPRQMDRPQPQRQTDRTRRGTITALLVVAAVVLGAAVALAVHTSDGLARVTAAHPSNPIQGPQPKPVIITSSAGATTTTITCPQGSQPYVFIQNAFFTPKLKLGTNFVPGTYHIELTGTVANETTSKIVVDHLIPWALDVAWRGAKVTAPRVLRANSSGRLIIRGTYTSRKVRAASVGATLRWHWADSSLQPCGKRGLVDDD
jgi:hypothetical protein